MMIEIFGGDGYDADLQAIQSHPIYETYDVDLIGVFLEQIATSEDASWKLKEWSASSSNPHFNVSAIASLQQSGYNLYRLRPLSKKLKKYRILYAYNGRSDEVYLLAVVIKKMNTKAGEPTPAGDEYYDYERTHRVTLRVLREYDQLALPKCH